MSKTDLFPTSPRFRAKPLKRMHVMDAGDSGDSRGTWAVVQCVHCGHSEERFGDKVSDIKRGIPCPNCNQSQTS